MIDVCMNCGISYVEIETVAKNMGMKINKDLGCYHNFVEHSKKCGMNWGWIKE